MPASVNKKLHMLIGISKTRSFPVRSVKTAMVCKNTASLAHKKASRLYS